MEQKTAEVRRADAQLLYDAFNASPIGIALENMEGQPFFVNPALCSMLGFSEEEMRTRHCVEFSPQEDAEKDWALFQQLRAGNIKHYQLEKRFFRRNGSLMWGRVSISLFNHTSPMVIAMVEDISEKKTAEELRSLNAAIVESSDDAILSKTLDGTILTWNEGAHRIYGYTEAEIIGRPVTILSPPELLDEQGKLLERLRAGEHVRHFETVRLNKAGQRVNVSLSVAPVRDSSGRIIALSAIARDITARKITEEALKKSEDKFCKAFQNSPMALALTGAVNHRYIDVNDSFERLSGWRRAEVIGRTPLDIEIWVEPAERLHLAKQLLAGDPVRDVEVGYRRKDRVEMVGVLSAELIEIESEPCVLTGVIDITERKRAEALVAGMSRKLIEAQERDRTWVARELHDDISQRLGLLAIELEQLQQQQPDHYSELHNRIGNLRARVAEISGRVQGLSHELHSSKLEYLGLVAAVKSWCKEFGEFHKMEIKFTTQDVPSFLAPEISLCLFRVLQEALHNAAKHSGVKKTDVQLVERSGEVHLIVTDPGRGFDVEAAIHGQGLGLTSMRERVRLLDGTMTIDSKSNRGTTVHVTFPLLLQGSHLAAG